MKKVIRYDKLVRDRIPDVLAAKHIVAQTHIATPEEYKKLLIKKLKEEVEEFALEQNTQELADILEALNALIDTCGFSHEEIEAVRAQKLHDRGGFVDRIVLEQTEE